MVKMSTWGAAKSSISRHGVAGQKVGKAYATGIPTFY